VAKRLSNDPLEKKREAASHPDRPGERCNADEGSWTPRRRPRPVWGGHELRRGLSPWRLRDPHDRASRLERTWAGWQVPCHRPRQEQRLHAQGRSVQGLRAVRGGLPWEGDLPHATPATPDAIGLTEASLFSFPH